jgi:alginate export protein
LAALLVVAFTVPAAALENEFGGYWRTRFFTEGHFNGEDSTATNNRRVDTRTRLYYTAKINDNLKFVNKFEMDAVWGESQYVAPTTYAVVDGAGVATGNFVTVNNPQNSFYGDVGADGVRVEVKNSYADFNLGPVNLTVGVQPYALFREFYISDDASGIIARWKVLDNFVLAGSWLKNFEGGAGTGNNEDIDAYTLTGAFWFSENISIKPSISYARASELNIIAGLGLLGNVPGTAITTPGLWGEVELFTYGFDFDASFDNFDIWATLVGQSGDVEQTGVGDLDLKGWLAAVGGSVGFDMFDIHGQVMYTPGDDNALDTDVDTFFCPSGSYYWSEIMGFGIFDNSNPVNTPGDKIQNVMAVNLGTKITPMDKLSVKVDLWYAKLDEDIVFAPGVSEDELGTELDVVVTYELVEGLNLDLVGAYLWAGDAVSADGNNDEDPYEFGARLSLSF